MKKVKGTELEPLELTGRAIDDPITVFLFILVKGYLSKDSIENIIGRIEVPTILNSIKDDGSLDFCTKMADKLLKSLKYSQILEKMCLKDGNFVVLRTKLNEKFQDMAPSCADYFNSIDDMRRRSVEDIAAAIKEAGIKATVIEVDESSSIANVSEDQFKLYLEAHIKHFQGVLEDLK